MDVVELTRTLIRQPSITPSDSGCQQIITNLLEGLGFRSESMRFGEVDNLWARRGRV